MFSIAPCHFVRQWIQKNSSQSWRWSTCKLCWKVLNCGCPFIVENCLWTETPAVVSIFHIKLGIWIDLPYCTNIVSYTQISVFTQLYTPMLLFFIRFQIGSYSGIAHPQKPHLFVSVGKTPSCSQWRTLKV